VSTFVVVSVSGGGANAQYSLKDIRKKIAKIREPCATTVARGSLISNARILTLRSKPSTPCSKVFSRWRLPNDVVSNLHRNTTFSFSFSN